MSELSPPPSIARRASNISGFSGNTTTSTSSSRSAKSKAIRSTGRGGSGNIKHTAAQVDDSDVTFDRAHAIGGREAPVASTSSAKIMSTGRGGAGNSAKARARREQAMPELPSRTAAIVAQYQSREDQYERDVISSSAEVRKRQMGSSGRGGAGNNYLKASKSPILLSSGASTRSGKSSSSGAPSSLVASILDPDVSFSTNGPNRMSLNPRYRPRTPIETGKFWSKLKIGKKDKGKGRQPSLKDLPSPVASGVEPQDVASLSTSLSASSASQICRLPRPPHLAGSLANRNAEIYVDGIDAGFLSDLGGHSASSREGLQAPWICHTNSSPLSPPGSYLSPTTSEFGEAMIASSASSFAPHSAYPLGEAPSRRHFSVYHSSATASDPSLTSSATSHLRFSHSDHRPGGPSLSKRLRVLNLGDNDYDDEVSEDVLDTQYDNAERGPPYISPPSSVDSSRPIPILRMPSAPRRETHAPVFYDRQYLSPTSPSTDGEEEASHTLGYRRSVASSVTSTSTLVDDRNFSLPLQRDKKQIAVTSQLYHTSSRLAAGYSLSASPPSHPNDYRRAPLFSHGLNALATVNEVPTKHQHADMPHFPAVPMHAPGVDISLVRPASQVEDGPPPYTPSRRPLPEVPRTLPSMPSAPQSHLGASFFDDRDEDEACSDGETVEVPQWPAPPRIALSM